LSNESAAPLNILIIINTFSLLKTLYYLQHALIRTLTTSGVINPIGQIVVYVFVLYAFSVYLHNSPELGKILGETKGWETFLTKIVMVTLNHRWRFLLSIYNLYTQNFQFGSNSSPHHSTQSTWVPISWLRWYMDGIGHTKLMFVIPWCLVLLLFIQCPAIFDSWCPPNYVCQCSLLFYISIIILKNIVVFLSHHINYASLTFIVIIIPTLIECILPLVGSVGLWFGRKTAL
jgi:hypothetical protein